jgi:hypothetical protein
MLQLGENEKLGNLCWVIRNGNELPCSNFFCEPAKTAKPLPMVKNQCPGQQIDGAGFGGE